MFPSLQLTHAMQAFQLMRVGAVLLTGILLTKTGLGKAEIGHFELLLYVGSTVVFLGINGLLQGISPVYVREGEQGQAKLIAQVFGVFTAIAIAVFAVFYGGKSVIVPFLSGQPELPYFGWFCLYLLLNIPVLPVEIVYLVKKRPIHLVLWGLFSFGMQVLVVFVPAMLGWGLGAAIQGLVALAAVKLLWGIVVFLQYASIGRADHILQQYLQLSWPLMANTLLGNLIGLFDNWLVAHWYNDPAQFAIYRYGSREIPLALALATALGMALTPRLAEHIDTGLAEVKDRTRRLFHAVFPVSILLTVTATWWFPAVFNHDFAVAAPLFQVYALIVISRVLLPNAILTGLGDTSAIFKTGILEMVVKVIAGVIGIQFFGLMGVAWSMVLCCWLEKAVLMYYLYRRYQITPGRWLDWRWLTGYAGLLLLSAFLN